jgi:hypothetical protein
VRNLVDVLITLISFDRKKKFVAIAKLHQKYSLGLSAGKEAPSF